MLKKLLISSYFAIALSCISSVGLTAERRQFFEEQTFSSGARGNITIVEQNTKQAFANKAIRQAFAKMKSIDEQLGSKPGNTREHLNNLKKGKDYPLSPEIFTLFSKAIYLSKVTNGWFDLAAPSAPSSFTQRDYRRIILNKDKKSIRYKSNKMSLDMRWFLKAAMVDTAIASLQASGVTNAKVEIDGVSRHIGHDIYTPWSIVVGLTKQGENKLAHRAFRYDLTSAATVLITPQNAGNLIDAKNKQKIFPQAQSVTTLASTALNAAAYAIAAYSVDPETAMRYIDRNSSVSGFVVDLTGNLYTAKGLAKNMQKSLESMEAKAEVN